MAPSSTSDKSSSKDGPKTDPQIRVILGPGPLNRSFGFSKSVLTFYSGYFAKAVDDNHAKSHEYTVRLPKEDPKLWRFFQNWVNTRQFYNSVLLPDPSFDLDTMAKLWAFGERYEAPMFQNAVVDAITARMRQSKAFFESATIQRIFDNTKEGSPLRRLLVETLSELLGWGWDWTVQDLDNTLVEDVIIAAGGLHEIGLSSADLAKVFAGSGSGPRWQCTWHVHVPGESCLPESEV